MSRTERRAQQAAVRKLKPVPNISGTDESCESCAMSVHPELMDRVIKVQAQNELSLGRPAPQAMMEDEVRCMYPPGGGLNMKKWGWCGQWCGTLEQHRAKR